MVAQRAFLAALILVLGACDVGEVPIGGSGVDAGSDPAALSFNMTVRPMVARCVGCHAGIQPPNLSDYGKLDAKYKMKPGRENILVTKGRPTAGMHSGMPYLSADEQTRVANWIDSL